MMMAVQETPRVSISLITALKSIRFLETLKRIRFSGQLVLTDPKEQQWIFYLYLGSIIYATGGTHPVRRWQRNLAAHCPQIPAVHLTLQRELAENKDTALTTCWEYQLLCLWVAQQKITPEQAAKTMHAILCEVLFDVVQVMRVTSQIKQDNSLPKPLVLIDVQHVIAEVNQLWQGWWNAKVAKYSPNMAATIKQPEQLQRCTTAQVYQILTKLLNGQHPLRDLALQMRQDVVQVTRSLLPYIELGFVELVSVPDLPVPVDVPVLKKPPTPVILTRPLIACVDDSPLICQTMEALLVAAGYQFVGVEDALRSFAILLACKPDVIFLDLMMPHTNGYEICAKLRKIAGFRNTPIVILSGNDGIVDQVRAKLVGASDFLSKPVDAGIVLSVIRKHLKPGVQG